MERLEKVHELIQETGLDETTVLESLLRWLSEDQVDEFVDDLARTWDLG